MRDYVAGLEAQEEIKSWMALGSSDKSTLMTLPQLLRVIEENWKDEFDDVIRDKALLQEARLLVHLRKHHLPYEYPIRRNGAHQADDEGLVQGRCALRRGRIASICSVNDRVGDCPW